MRRRSSPYRDQNNSEPVLTRDLSFAPSSDQQHIISNVHAIFSSTRCLNLITSTTAVTIKTPTLPLLITVRWHTPPLHRHIPKQIFILPSLFPTLRITFILFLRWRKTNMAPRPSYSTFMPVLTEFYIMVSPLRTIPHQEIPEVLNLSSGPPLTPPSFSGYILQSPLTFWPPSWNQTPLLWKHGIVWLTFFRTTKMLGLSLLSKNSLTL